MFDMQGYIIYVVLYFVIWLEFISESYFYVPTINKVLIIINNNISNHTEAIYLNVFALSQYIELQIMATWVHSST